MRAAVIAAAAMVLVAVVVPLASANGPMPGTEQLELTLPADGSGTATRAPMPADSTAATVTVNETSSDPSFESSLTEFLLAGKPTLGARVVQCVFLSVALTSLSDEEVGFEESGPVLQLLLLNVCIQTALKLKQQGMAPHALGAPAAGKCGMTQKAVPLTITRTGSGYTATVSGMTSTSKRTALRIGCSTTAHGMKLSLRPKSRKAKLAKVIGPTVGIGFASSSSSPGKLQIALGVR